MTRAYVCVCFQWLWLVLSPVGKWATQFFQIRQCNCCSWPVCLQACCYRAKQPISLLPTIRTTNHFSSPTASLHLRANYMTHVVFFSTSLFFLPYIFITFEMWIWEGNSQIFSGSLGLNHTPPCTAQWDWNGHLDFGISITVLVHAGIAFPKIQHRAVWQFMLYSYLSRSLMSTAVLCCTGCCSVSEMVLTSFRDKPRNCEFYEHTHVYKYHCTQTHTHIVTLDTSSLVGSWPPGLD